ncbi:MAG: metal ABC transporter substrate-binding protein [Thermaerobacterales bacterium]
MRYRFKMSMFLLVLGLTILLAAGCGNSADDGQAGDDSLKVVTSYSIIYDLVIQVAGDRAEVTSLVPLGQDPHQYEPTPADIRAVAESDIVFFNGFNLELWFDRLVANAGGERPVVEVSGGIEPRLIEVGGYTGYPDPHAWMDVALTIKYVENIRDAMIDNDPEGRGDYEANAAAYVVELKQLDEWIREETARIPAGNRKLVTTEDAFQYFARAYEYKIVGFLYYIAADEEPSPRFLAQLIDRIRDEQVPAVFLETTLDPRLLQQIANEADVEIGAQVYVDSLGEPGSGVDTYIGMMRHNVEAFVTHLGGE